MASDYKKNKVQGFAVTSEILKPDERKLTEHRLILQSIRLYSQALRRVCV